uniref:Uncharacterized protein n=1 Tax=Eutreptiella gymnastica TaxID=73025 RepID=A0A7S4FRP3_9EUGL
MLMAILHEKSVSTELSMLWCALIPWQSAQLLKGANRQAGKGGQPKYLANSQHYHLWKSAVQVMQGHFCLVPVFMKFWDEVLRANDPLPCEGRWSRAAVARSLSNLATFVECPLVV